MAILQIVGLGIIGTFLALILKEQKASFAFILTLVVGIAIFLFLIDQIALVLRMIFNVAQKANLNFMYVETIMKIIGIAYIAEFGAQITSDAGQGAIASKIELAGKVLILVMAIPILSIIIETVLQLIPS
ncbi:stage III sporulation protein AD [Fictibacillus macauensis]|uniref:stage III sporulation protein AD n=1 Tax=Fictibacillus macauensis TaxID=245160 RepID=UPI000A0002E0|nr:stage III sporulation protein AD [Fictibacillus macauensis]